MSDPASAVGKLAGLVARPFVAIARSQIGRRGAQSIAEANPATVDKEFSEAIAVLRQKGDTISSEAWAWVKSHLSDRPAVFDDDGAQQWLVRTDVEKLLGAATLAMIAGQDLAPFEDDAKRLYAATVDDGDWYGGVLFHYAVAFLGLTLHAKISVDTRLLLAVAETHTEAIRSDLKDIGDTTERALELLEAMATAKAPPADVIDQYLDEEIVRRDAFRAIVNPDALTEARALGERTLAGNLAGATAPTRSRLFRFVAATCTRAGEHDEADIWLAHAEAAGADDLEPDRARIALQRGDPVGAITLLENRDDSLSNALRLHAIADRDGKAAAIDYFERFCAPDKLTGHFLATLANWIAEEGDIAAAERLLAGANPEQLADNCTLRFARMRYRLALVSPVDLRLEVVDNITLLPPPHTLSDDTEAGRLKAGALEDAIATLAVFDGRPTPNFMPLVELTRQYLGLVSEDPEARQHAREAVAAYLADPETRVTYVPLARLFDIDFDADALAAQLEQAARLSGWNDVQLRAAFDLVIHANDVQNIVAFADTHRDRLAAVVGPRLAFGIALEALARSGRVAEARERLAAIEPRVSAADHRFIADVVTDVAGEATPDLHLERYAQSQNDQDLALAVQSLVDARDA